MYIKCRNFYLPTTGPEFFFRAQTSRAPSPFHSPSEGVVAAKKELGVSLVCVDLQLLRQVKRMLPGFSGAWHRVAAISVAIGYVCLRQSWYWRSIRMSPSFDSDCHSGK